MQWFATDPLLSSDHGLDRGLQFGEALFETMLLRDGRLPLLEFHLDRLQRGCEQLSLPMPDVAGIESELRPHCQEPGRWVIKLIYSAGPGGRGYGRPDFLRPQLYIGKAPAPERHSGPLRLLLCEIYLAQQPQLAGIKHGNRLEQVLARREVDAAGCDEGLLLDSEGRVIEAVAANLFVVRAGKLLTPSLDLCGVDGVMRRAIMTLAQGQGLSVHVDDLTVADIESADEVFLSNSLQGIRSAEALLKAGSGSTMVGHWAPGPVAAQLGHLLEDRGWV